MIGVAILYVGKCRKNNLQTLLRLAEWKWVGGGGGGGGGVEVGGGGGGGD